MVQHQNLELDFSNLTTLNNPQGVHRAEIYFWRLLTDSTKGNPSTSLQLFKQCAIQTDTENTVAIRMFSLRQAEILNQLDDGAGFVLACVLMHNRCTLDELCNSFRCHNRWWCQFVGSWLRRRCYFSMHIIIRLIRYGSLG